MNHIEQRISEFQVLVEQLKVSNSFFTPHAVAVMGDSLDIIKKIPDNSISLILTDPPYHSTKKDNISNDKAFKTNDDFIDWMRLYRNEWKRILRPNGSIFLFCSSAMSAWLEVMFSETLTASRDLWRKCTIVLPIRTKRWPETYTTTCSLPTKHCRMHPYCGTTATIGSTRAVF